MDESSWEAEMQLRDLRSAAEQRLLETALLLVAQSEPGRREFPADKPGLDRLVAAVQEKALVEIAVIEELEQVRHHEFRLYVSPNGDGSLQLELVSGKEEGFAYHHVMGLWADGEVFGQGGSGEVDIDAIKREQERLGVSDPEIQVIGEGGQPQRAEPAPDAPVRTIERGRVESWDDDEGWGVLSANLPNGGVFAHFSVVEGEGYRTLKPGDSVTFDYTPAPVGHQDGCPYVAERVGRLAD